MKSLYYTPIILRTLFLMLLLLSVLSVSSAAQAQDKPIHTLEEHRAVATGQHLRTLTGHTSEVNSLSYSPDDTQTTAS